MKKIFMTALVLSSSISFAIDTTAVKDAMAKAKEKTVAVAKNVYAGCKDDAAKFKCEKKDKLKDCLMKHKDSLSDSCKSSLH